MDNELRTVYEFGPFRLDTAERRLSRRGRPVPLPGKVFDLLCLLVENSGHLLTKDELMRRIWPDSVVEDNNLTVSMSALRKALGDTRDARGYIETVPRVGYRFVAAIRPSDSPTPAPPRDVGEGARPLAGGRWGGPIDSIAVLPLVNAGGDADLEFLSDGITESIIDRLSHLPRVRVMARSTVFRYKGHEPDVRAAGRRLGVKALLTGSLRKVGGRLILNAELVRVADGTRLWGELYRSDFFDPFTLQEEMAREVSEKLRLKLTSEEMARLSKHHTENAEAYLLYLKGRHCWNKRSEEGVRKALEFFRAAISLDPLYALAYAGLADAYHSLCGLGVVAPTEGHPRAKEAALKALELDNSLAEAHASLGLISMRYDWDWGMAERELRRAISLNPNYALARHWLAIFLTAMGRSSEAIEECRRALSLDPLSLIINTLLGIHFYFARRYDEAIAQLDKTVELDPTFFYAHSGLAECYLALGMPERGVAAMEKAGALAGRDLTGTLTALAYTYAMTGREADARHLLDELLERAPRDYTSAYELAKIYVALEDYENAFAYLDRAYEEKDGNLLHLKIMRELDPLRPDPRFQSLLRRMNLAT